MTEFIKSASSAARSFLYTDGMQELREVTSLERKRPRAGRFFFRGIGVILPSVLMLWILVAAFRFVDGNIAEPINAGVRFIVASVAVTTDSMEFRPDEAEIVIEQARAAKLGLDRSAPTAQSRLVHANVAAWWAARWWLNLVGLVLAVAAVYVLGRLVGGFLGRRLLAAFESGLVAVPGIRQVYPALKQIVEFLFGGERKQLAFNRVVMIEYPRAGLWSMGLVTGDAAKELAPTVGDCVTVFVPSSPTPFTGWTVSVPRSEVREVPLSIDEALRYLVSAGVVVPGGGRPETTHVSRQSSTQ